MCLKYRHCVCVCVCSGTSITQLQAVDPDGEPLIFGVVGEEAMRYFAVQEATGVVWLRTAARQGGAEHYEQMVKELKDCQLELTLVI